MALRIEKIKTTYSQALNEKLNSERVDISLESAWDILISADPSRNRKNVRWLIETYLHDGYLWEDIASGPASKVSETLTEFDKHKRNLEPADRSLTKYQTLGGLWSAINPFVGQTTAGDEKREERERAYKEAEVIVDRDDGFKIVAPKTEYAAKWFGRGTRWCTAGDKENMFDVYNNQAPLFIILMPDGEKFQLWKMGGNIQFMNVNDDPVQLHYIEKNWHYFGAVCEWIDDIRYTPRNKITEELCIKTVNLLDHQKSHIVNRIPDDFITTELCEMIVRKNGLCLGFFPQNVRNEKICQLAVEQDGMALKYVPEDLKTPDLYLTAIKQNGLSLAIIPKKERTYELCELAVKQDGIALRDVPEQHKTSEIYDVAIRNDGLAISFVMEEDKTYELCKMAYELNSLAICNIPEQYDTSTWKQHFPPEYNKHENEHYDVHIEGLHRTQIEDMRKLFDVDYRSGKDMDFRR